MGKKEMKSSKHRSRSRSKERHHGESKSKHKKKERRDSSDSDSSSSRERRRHKHKHKSSDRRRSRSRSQDRKSNKIVIPEHRSVEDLAILKEERRKQKDAMKALETPEEKRARRLAKKEMKVRKRKEQMGWDDEYMGYTNADNPFGDEHLLDSFVWEKKLEKEGKKSLEKEQLEKMQKQKMEENRRELEKVKKRRLEREREMEERDSERERLQREKEAEYFREWEKQEDTFHLQQAKLRSKIRIDDARAKPIDLLARYVSAEDDDLAVEMHEPYTYLNGLTITDLEDLLEDIKVYVELEMGKNVDFWRDITIITEDELATLRKIDPTSKDHVGDRRQGINQSVHTDVASVFKGKSLNQLQLLEQQIKKKLKGGEGIDIGYWESLLGNLKAHMARTRLKERHKDVLTKKLYKLKAEQGISETQPLFPIIRQEGDQQNNSVAERSSPDLDSSLKVKSERLSPDLDTIVMPPPVGVPVSKPSTSELSRDEPQPGTSKDEDGEEQKDDGEVAILTEDDLIEQSYDEYESGKYSPRYLSPSELEADTIVYSLEDDIRRLEYAREKTMYTGKAKEDVEGEFEKRAREGMNDDEAQFSVEMPLEKKAVLWSDKYRPRKPRFFNRVHTGFEWNKYNQTHYDIDNPPPKIVQGYKFNIFYPDLIDKAKTPEYFLTPCEGDTDFAALRFHAGPPYEDIAFKIVNREWEYSYKRGFRCQFHNNIFQLWFHFKRYRYRR